MQTTCAILEVFGSPWCADYWLQRYQPLVVGVVALSIAALQVWIALRSLAVSRQLAAIQHEQQRSRMAQEETEKALATLAVDRLLVAANSTADKIVLLGMGGAARPGVATGEHRQFGWPPHVMAYAPQFLGEIVTTDEIEKNAALAFPDRATDIVQLAAAYNAVVAAAAEFKAAALPPLHEYVDADSPTAEQLLLEGHINTAINDLWWWDQRCQDLLPSRRVAA